MVCQQCSCWDDKQTAEDGALDTPLLVSTLWKVDLDFIPHLTMEFGIIGGTSAAQSCDGLYCYQWCCMACNSMETGHRLFAKKSGKSGETKLILYG